MQKTYYNQRGKEDDNFLLLLFSLSVWSSCDDVLVRILVFQPSSVFDSGYFFSSFLLLVLLK